MKKRELLLLLLVLTIIYQLLVVHSQSDSGGMGVGLELTDTSGPVINLTTPINNSGNSNENITFSYNVSDLSDLHNCSLIINNKINTTNATIIEKDTRLNFTLNNAAIGIYNWSINCTDNLGYVGNSPKRTVSVIFMTNFNGSTTNISLVNIRSITNFVLEILPYGKINFSEVVDISQGFDLDKNVNITSNRIELNSTALTVLNKLATLSLYGLTFTNPRPLRDGTVCPSSICTEVSYSPEKTFVFDVTQFTVYSSEETPEEAAPPPPSAPGAGGGGGGAPGRIPDFTTDKKTLKIILKQGETKEETLNIKNTGKTVLDITTYLQPLRKFIFSPSLDEIKTTLNPDEEQTLNFVFGAEKDQKPDVYTGEIVIKSQTIEKIINTILEIESARPLFDVDVEVLPQYKSITPGEDLVMEVSLFNVRGFGRVDVNLEYSIKDFKGNLIAKEEETVAVETQAKFVRELLVPSDLKPGTYVASVKVTFEDSVGTSSDLFEIKAKAIRLYPISIKDYRFYLLVGIVLVVSGIFVYLIYGYLPRKRHMPKTKEEEDKLIKTEEKIKKLEKELKALEKAYKSKFISGESYQKGKERIEKDLKKLGK